MNLIEQLNNTAEYLHYRYFNDGDIPHDEEDRNVRVNSLANFIIAYVPTVERMFDRISSTDEVVYAPNGNSVMSEIVKEVNNYTNNSHEYNDEPALDDKKLEYFSGYFKLDDDD